MMKILHYNKAWLTVVGFALTLVTQINLPHPSPVWLAIQGAATSLAVLLVPNAPKEGKTDVVAKQGTEPTARRLP